MFWKSLISVCSATGRTSCRILRPSGIASCCRPQEINGETCGSCIVTTLGVATKLATTLGPALSLERASVLSCRGGQKLGQALAARQLAESRLKSIEAVSQQLEAPVNHTQKRRLSNFFNYVLQLVSHYVSHLEVIAVGTIYGCQLNM